MKFNYKRVIVIGNNGSGKSYFSKKLAEATNLPLIHLDLLYWQNGGVHPSREEWADVQRKLVAREQWILDGMHISTLEIRFKEADAIFFLDFDTSFCVESVKQREIERKLENGERDSLHSQTFDEFLKGVMDFNEKRKPRILELKEKYPNKSFIVLNTRSRCQPQLNPIWSDK